MQNTSTNLSRWEGMSESKPNGYDSRVSANSGGPDPGLAIEQQQPSPITQARSRMAVSFGAPIFFFQGTPPSPAGTSFGRDWLGRGFSTNAHTGADLDISSSSIECLQHRQSHTWTPSHTTPGTCPHSMVPDLQGTAPFTHPLIEGQQQSGGRRRGGQETWRWSGECVCVCVRRPTRCPRQPATLRSHTHTRPGSPSASSTPPHTPSHALLHTFHNIQHGYEQARRKGSHSRSGAAGHPEGADTAIAELSAPDTTTTAHCCRLLPARATPTQHMRPTHAPNTPDPIRRHRPDRVPRACACVHVPAPAGPPRRTTTASDNRAQLGLAVC